MGIFYSRKNEMEVIDMNTLDEGMVAETGDILLFEGNSAFGIFEEIMTKSPYSHVAMFVRDPTTNALYVWESSNADNNKDELSGMKKEGPRLIKARNKIEEYLQLYGNGVIYRKLIKPKGTKVFSAEQWSYLKKFMEKEVPKTFEKYIYTMGESYTHRLLFPRIQDLSSVFCSEEIANTWIWAGVPLYRRPDQHCPQDFSEKQQNLFDYQGDPLETAGWGLSQEFNIKLKDPQIIIMQYNPILKKKIEQGETVLIPWVY